jgi:hypothetical protein
VDRREKAILLAQEEVNGQAWALTRQLLAVNAAEIGEDGDPVVARVDEDTESGAYFIYFPIRGEPYFFVVVVRPDEAGELAVSWIYMEGGTRVYLLITSEIFSPEEITARVGLTPTKSHQMGDPVRKKSPARTYRVHMWHFEPQKGIPGTVEEKLKVLLEEVNPAVAQIADLRPMCDVGVMVVFEGWGGDWQFGGIHFETEIVQGLAALGATLDLDLYAFGPDMPDDGKIFT